MREGVDVYTGEVLAIGSYDTPYYYQGYPKSLLIPEEIVELKAYFREYDEIIDNHKFQFEDWLSKNGEKIPQEGEWIL